MPNRSPMSPDPLPLREALRGLRHVLRKGGQSFADTVSTEGLPKPAATVANSMLREGEGILRNLDSFTSGLAKTVLGGETAQTLHLSDLPQSEDANAQFAQTVYMALRSVLDQLGAPDVFISEAAARAVYRQIAPAPDDQPAMLAANLTLDLLAARVLRGTTAQQPPRLQGVILDAVAVFAVLLWLQSDRSDAENKAALAAATDLAIAVSDDIAAACDTIDAARLAALYAKYAPHV